MNDKRKYQQGQRPRPERVARGNRGLDIVYEDDSIIAINKPSGLLSIAAPGKSGQTAYSLVGDYLKRRSPKARVAVVHRLDRDTSGVMIFVKSARDKRTMMDEWNERVSERRYVAVVEGRPKEAEGLVESYLVENRAGMMYSSRDGKGLRAVTRYRVVKSSRGFSLVELDLETGRKNQIRVHMYDLGCPVAGDAKYGSRKNPLGRLALHATSIVFSHPQTNEGIRLEAPMPREFERLF